MSSLGATLLKDGTCNVKSAQRSPRPQQRCLYWKRYGRTTLASMPNASSKNCWSYPPIPTWCETLTLLVQTGTRFQAFENMSEKSSFHLFLGRGVCKKPTTVYSVRAKVSWADRDDSSPVLNVGRRLSLVTSQGMRASTKRSYKAPLKANSGPDGNALACQTTSKWTDRIMTALPRATVNRSARRRLFVPSANLQSNR